jgi:NAD(P)-dependent dehydrogenase (short-subunit alcohol dehydrogenase family)
VYGTSRKPDTDSSSGIKWISNVDIGSPHAGQTIVDGYKESSPISIIVITAGYFATEDLEKPNWDAEVQMYTTSAIGPVFLISKLVSAGLLKAGAKIIMVSSESGSITLRHEKEGGGNYAHHASKAALNMVTKLLSLDLKDKGIAVVSVHPGFMRTDMTKGVGFDKYWDDGGGENPIVFSARLVMTDTGPAVTPDVAATSLIKWIETFDMSKTGEYWAPRGPR